MMLAFALAQTKTISPPPPKAAEEVESPSGSPQKELALTIAKLLSNEDTAVMEPKLVIDKVVSPVTTTLVDGGSGQGVGLKIWLLGSVLEKVRRAELRRVDLGFRVVVFCLLSLSVIVADTTRGLVYTCYKCVGFYLLGVPVGGGSALPCHMETMIRDPWAKYFSLAMDQARAPILSALSIFSVSYHL
ncbi:hypothetical protein GUJ93_ZPchr0005g15717 [Zizania palustris]|uniref:CASP-like protein n=1 Tax=Zizania palustris TaxID=103762 RepID=A0A8J5SH00_ZIZPA|nr:hypothetical protein GUJ93_ZPchr0005g15717 [Zizania palustris]